MSRFTVIDAEQRSEMWLAARAGRATGSRAGDILAKLKSGGEAAVRRDYRLQLAVEVLTGRPQDGGYINVEMQRGIDCEPLALAAYEAQSGNVLRRTGFLAMNEVRAGCSLDADVDDFAGIVEAKCPKSATHIAYLKGQKVPPEYVPQLTHNIWVTGAQWADFVSWDDRLPEGLQYFCVRVRREELDIKGYEAELTRFLAEVTIEVRDLQGLRSAA